jgi:hypothetical protein
VVVLRSEPDSQVTLLVEGVNGTGLSDFLRERPMPFSPKTALLGLVSRIFAAISSM